MRLTMARHSMLVFCACLLRAKPNVGSQCIFDLRVKHVALRMISMWRTDVSCAEVVTDGVPDAESIRGRGGVRVGGGPYAAWPV